MHSLLKLAMFRRNSSAYKLKEMSGSNIFSAGGEDIASESGPVNGNANYRTSVRIVQVLVSSYLRKLLPHRTRVEG